MTFVVCIVDKVNAYNIGIRKCVTRYFFGIRHIGHLLTVRYCILMIASVFFFFLNKLNNIFITFDVYSRPICYRRVYIVDFHTKLRVILAVLLMP